MNAKRGSTDTSFSHKIIFPFIKINNQELESKEINNDKKSPEKENEGENGKEDIYMEKQLSLLLEVFLTSYSKRTYSDLIKDIQEKETLLYTKSIMSFKILTLKIKCFLKLLLTEYNNILTLKTHNFHEIDNVVQKIQNEFKKISSMVMKNNSYEFEILTQLYCKFLYLLSKISLKKEDNIKSLGFISLGVNMLKIFILRKKLATDIHTYKIYCKLLLSLINILIGDNNYEQALLYSRLLIKVIEISQKFIFFHNQEHTKEDSIPPTKAKKFINYAGYAFLYIGCCLEQFENDIAAFEAYKQAKYFLDKGSFTGNPFKTVNIISINNSCNYCAVEVSERLNLKFQKDKIDRLYKQNKLEKLKRLKKFQLLQNEKQYKLKLVASGYIGDPFKYNDLEEKIEKAVFPSSVLNEIEKVDEELMSFVFTYFNKNKKNSENSNKNRLSSNTKKLLSRFELYNFLMSKDFRDFVMKTKKLQFNNPKKVSESISLIQRYLNNKMEIKIEMKQKNDRRKKTIKLLEKPNLTNYLLKKNINDFNTITFSTTGPSSSSKRGEDKEEKIPRLFSLHNSDIKKKIKFSLDTINNKESSITNRIRKSKTRLSPSFIIPAKLNRTRNKKIIIKSNLNELESDFERKNFDKYLMTKNYLRKYSYYQSLSNKEIKVQKALLDFRSHNTLYNPKKAYEENDAKLITKEEINNKFLMINEGVNEKVKVVTKDEDLEMIKDSFSIDNKISSKMKSAMSKVINKYIMERKKKAKKYAKIFSKEDIKKINDKNLLNLNYSIRALNNNINHIKKISRTNITD